LESNLFKKNKNGEIKTKTAKISGINFNIFFINFKFFCYTDFNIRSLIYTNMPNRPITTKEREAWKFAKQAHKGQVRKFIGLPYFDAHVKKVNEIVKRYTTDEDLLCAAILHDVPEDCYEDYEVGLAEIENLFGSRVSKLVSELTSIKDEIDEVYDGDKAAYLSDKMIHMSDDALIIKLSDRLQNISDAFTAAERFRNKYFEETWQIVEDLEKHRQFNRIHTLLLNEIKAKLSNIGSIFRIKRFRDFDETH
jgi:(p)ppGpp synthase/HD superfamily hydrolase